MSKYIDSEKLIAEIKRRRDSALERQKNLEKIGQVTVYNEMVAAELNRLISFADSLQQEQSDEQPEYGYLFTEYIHGKKSIWSVGDVLAYYISTSNEEGEYILGKIVNIEFDEEDGWVYTFEDESTLDEQSLVEEGAYKKN